MQLCVHLLRYMRWTNCLPLHMARPCKNITSHGSNNIIVGMLTHSYHKLAPSFHLSICHTLVWTPSPGSPRPEESYVYLQLSAFQHFYELQALLQLQYCVSLLLGYLHQLPLCKHRHAAAWYCLQWLALRMSDQSCRYLQGPAD